VTEHNLRSQLLHPLLEGNAVFLLVCGLGLFKAERAFFALPLPVLFGIVEPNLPARLVPTYNIESEARDGGVYARDRV